MKIRKTNKVHSVYFFFQYLTFSFIDPLSCPVTLIDAMTTSTTMTIGNSMDKIQDPSYKLHISSKELSATEDLGVLEDRKWTNNNREKSPNVKKKSSGDLQSTEKTISKKTKKLGEKITSKETKKNVSVSMQNSISSTKKRKPKNELDPNEPASRQLSLQSFFSLKRTKT